MDEFILNRMRVITSNLSDLEIKWMDEQVAEGKYPSRSEIIRIALQYFLKEVHNVVLIEKIMQETMLHPKLEPPLPKTTESTDNKVIIYNSDGSKTVYTTRLKK